MHGFLGIIVKLFFHLSDPTLKLSKFIVTRSPICLTQLVKLCNKLLPKSLAFLLEFRESEKAKQKEALGRI